MPRQRLTKKHSKSGLALGPGFLSERPQAALLIAECIAAWTEVELQTTRLLAAMLQANTKPAVAMYFTLVNERAKREAMAAIAEFVFNEEECRVYTAIAALKDSLAKQRSHLAHGLFGVADEEKDGVAWISTKDRIRHMIDIELRERSDDPSNRPTRNDYIAIKEHVSVYSIADLQSLRREIMMLHSMLLAFIQYLSPSQDSETKQKLFHILSNEPLVQKFLSPKSANPKSGS